VGDRPIPREVLADRAAAYFLDLDGTLLDESGPIPGAAAALQALRRRGIPFRVLTNTSRHSRRRVLSRMAEYEFDVRFDEVFTAVYAGVAWLRARSIERIAPFVSEDALEDLREFALMGGVSGAKPSATPEAVVVGDMGAAWTHEVLNEALRYLLDGAALVALQRGRYWMGPSGLEVDAGAYVAALEYAADTESVVCGKPNTEFFTGAVASLPAGSDAPDASGIVMVGDDLWNDVDGAQRAGLEGWLVRTGKFRQQVLDASGIVPDRVIDSVAVLAS
jgi:HAD superfamily hydrolase (TIGR01458 family)